MSGRTRVAAALSGALLLLLAGLAGAASSELLRGLRAGDRIAFGLQATPDALLVVSIKRVSPPHSRSTSD